MDAERDSSVDPPVTSERRRWKVVQGALALLLVGFAGWYLWKQWRDASASQLRISVDPLWLTLASAIVLATYLLLVETWRRVLARYGSRIAFREAMRIWFVSNLGKYVPGKLWQVTAMTVMTNQLRVPVATSAGAAAVVTIANVVAGFALLLFAGMPTLRALGGRYESAVLVSTLVLLAALLAAPFTMRVLSAGASRILRRPLMIDMPLSAVWIGLAGCGVAWVLYGSAFQLLVLALLGKASAPWLSYVAVYTLSYLVGYLVLIAPGGVGAREATLVFLLVTMRLASPAEAAVITVASRLWLTVLEIVPGVLFMLTRGSGRVERVAGSG